MAMSGARRCCAVWVGLVPLALLTLSVVLAILGWTGAWGIATYSIGGIVSGDGVFTLRTIRMNSEVAGFKTPEATYWLDDTLCSGQISWSEVDEVCNKFSTMRVFTVLTIIASILAVVTSCVACAIAMRRKGSRMMARVMPGLAILAALGAATFSVVALVIAGSLPRDNEYFQPDRATAGVGSVAMGLLVVSSVLATIFELALCCCCAGRREADHEHHRHIKQHNHEETSRQGHEEPV